MGSAERDSNLRVLIHSSYPVGGERPSGVGNFVKEIVPHLKSLGCEVATLGPVRKGEKDEADFHLGRARILHAVGTNIPAAVSFNKLSARETLIDFKPHLIVSHEPAVPNSSHTLFSAIPRREDGKRAIAVIGQFHASEPPNGLDWKAKGYVAAAKIVRRPKFYYGIPTGVTNGYMNTIEDALAGRIAVSKEGTADYWYKMFPADYKVIYNGINVETFTPDGKRFRDWGKNGEINLFAAGRPEDERKGFEYLILAYGLLRSAGLNNLRLNISGGYVTPRLREIIRMKDIPDVNFFGMLPQEEFAEAYRSADIVIAPSTGGEGFNRTIAEARVSGALVIATNIKGQREAIGEDLKPFMANPADPQDLALRIGEVINISEEGRIALAGFSRGDAIGKFAWKIIAPKHLEYYNEIVRKHGALLDWSRVQESLLRFIPGIRQLVVNDRLGRAAA